MRVLLIEDNQALAASIFEFLEANGHVLDAAPDGVTGLYLARNHPFDVVVLDWGLPRMPGIDVLRELRSELGPEPPVLMLTARTDIEDKLAGFQAGANDYLAKPFQMPELEARLLALANRGKSMGPASLLRVADISLDPSTHAVTRAGQPIRLYRACRKLLEVLMRASPAVVPRVELEHALWGDAVPDADLLRSHMYELRRAVDGPFPVKLIHTVAREGYRLAAEND
ncbi:MAG: response regulator transcription factor [Xanthomonadaceae bacterium]|nr:response regulator transcription factor [Xanthomonadaceae bacterium]